MASPKKMDDETRAAQEISDEVTAPCLPAAPDPSTDPGIVPPITSPLPDEGILPENMDIFALTPVAALKMLCKRIDFLVELIGDVPPTPPLRSQNPSPSQTPALGTRSRNSSKENIAFSTRQRTEVPSTAIGSPEAHHTEPMRIIGAGAEPVYIQQGAIARKFYSKRPPPISTEDYLMRMHRYCPMSTAVYLATSLYIDRLAVVEKLIPVTPRNVHRLLLAGLRVAMKALEDLSYPHNRFAKVGGVTEAELARLEVTFCFLTNFELKVDAAMLQQQASSHRQADSLLRTISPAALKLIRPEDEKSQATSAPPLPTRSLLSAVETPS